MKSHARQGVVESGARSSSSAKNCQPTIAPKSVLPGRLVPFSIGTRLGARLRCKVPAGSGFHDGRIVLLKSLDSMLVAPAEETVDRLTVRASRVRISDVRGEELNEAPRCSVAGRGDRHRHSFEPGAGKLAVGWLIGHR
jgi:hypothetical protein